MSWSELKPGSSTSTLHCYCPSCDKEWIAPADDVEGVPCQCGVVYTSMVMQLGQRRFARESHFDKKNLKEDLKRELALPWWRKLLKA